MKQCVRKQNHRKQGTDEGGSLLLRGEKVVFVWAGGVGWGGMVEGGRGQQGGNKRACRAAPGVGRPAGRLGGPCRHARPGRWDTSVVRVWCGQGGGKSLCVCVGGGGGSYRFCTAL